MVDISNHLTFISTLVSNSLHEIHHDLSQNILTRFPIAVIFNPEYYTPPFITNLYKLLKHSDIAPFIKTPAHIACLFLDIFYGFVRLFISFIICGFFTCLQGLLLFWILLILIYRWEPLNISQLADWSLVT